jgi:hypothetical protein
MNPSRSLAPLFLSNCLCGSRMPTLTIRHVVPDKEDYETLCMESAAFQSCLCLNSEALYAMMVQFKIISASECTVFEKSISFPSSISVQINVMDGSQGARAMFFFHGLGSYVLMGELIKTNIRTYRTLRTACSRNYVSLCKSVKKGSNFEHRCNEQVMSVLPCPPKLGVLCL